MDSVKGKEAIGVLLVDDHPAVLWGLEKLIDGELPRMRVVGKVYDCGDVVATAATSNADVVLLDLDLGGESTLDLIPELRRRGRVKVVVLTGIKNDDIREQAFINGAHGYVGKCEPAGIILKAIECVCGGELWLDRRMTGQVFERLSLGGMEKKPAADAYEALTAREVAIVAGVVKHKSSPNKVIADSLHISPNTLRNHLAAVYGKLGIHRRVDLVMYAAERGSQRNMRGLGSVESHLNE